MSTVTRVAIEQQDANFANQQHPPVTTYARDVKTLHADNSGDFLLYSTMFEVTKIVIPGRTFKIENKTSHTDIHTGAVTPYGNWYLFSSDSSGTVKPMTIVNGVARGLSTDWLPFPRVVSLDGQSLDGAVVTIIGKNYAGHNRDGQQITLGNYTTLMSD